MTTPPKRRVYPNHPAVPTTQPAQYPGPQVIIDVSAAFPSSPLPTPPTTPSGPGYNVFQRTYGHNSRHEPNEDDLVQRINILEHAVLFPDLLERASCKKQLAEKKAPDKTVMTPLILSAYEDLLKAAHCADDYTFGESIKQAWLSKIAEARTELTTLAKQYQILFVQPAAHPKIPRIVGGIFAVLALLFSASVALHYVIRKHRPGIF